MGQVDSISKVMPFGSPFTDSSDLYFRSFGQYRVGGPVSAVLVDNYDCYVARGLEHYNCNRFKMSVVAGLLLEFVFWGLSDLSAFRYSYRMDDYLNGLPDDISPNIISFLTVRDSCKVRCLLLGWKDLPDTRSVLRFDGYTIFGEENFCLASQDQRSKFVKAVDQFFKFWVAPKASALNVKFGLGNEYASHIDGWFESIRGKEVEELNLDFLFHYRNSSEKYVFPCHLLETEKAPHLKHLRLQFCDMKLICDTSARWLSSLSTLELACVSIRSSQLECILSSSTNLETLILRSCGFTERLLVQHTALKKLVIEEHSQRVHLICPKLKAFEFSGSCILTFSLFSFLREASFNFFYNRDGFFDFGSLSRNAPQLQTLSLWLSEKVPTLPLSMAMSNLKRLNLFLHIQQGFDFLTITHMLRISPVLEELNLKLKTDIVTVLPPERQDLHRHPPHFHLKVLRVTFGMVEWSMFGLVEYLLRVSVSLQQMVLVVGADAAPFLRRHHMFSKLTYINPDVEFTII